MSNFILGGLFTEGTTDVRFLSSVIERTLVEVAFDCSGQIETKLEIIEINKSGLNFNEQVKEACKIGFEKFGILLLFVHADADSIDDSQTFQSRINPAIAYVNQQDEELFCKHLVAVVPIQTTESWMLADKALLKSEIGVVGSDVDFGIHRNPEEIADPKALIENIIRISKEDNAKRKRRKGLMISDLYQIIGQQIDILDLEKLSSYIKFKKNLIDKLRELNFYHQ